MTKYKVSSKKYKVQKKDTIFEVSKNGFTLKFPLRTLNFALYFLLSAFHF